MFWSSIVFIFNFTDIPCTFLLPTSSPSLEFPFSLLHTFYTPVGALSTLLVHVAYTSTMNPQSIFSRAKSPVQNGGSLAGSPKAATTSPAPLGSPWDLDFLAAPTPVHPSTKLTADQTLKGVDDVFDMGIFEKAVEKPATTVSHTPFKDYLLHSTVLPLFGQLPLMPLNLHVATKFRITHLEFPDVNTKCQRGVATVAFDTKSSHPHQYPSSKFHVRSSISSDDGNGL